MIVTANPTADPSLTPMRIGLWDRVYVLGVGYGHAVGCDGAVLLVDLECGCCRTRALPCEIVTLPQDAPRCALSDGGTA